MRKVLKKLLRVGLVIAVVLAPVVISGTVMVGEAGAIKKSVCKAWADMGAEEGAAHGFEDGEAGNYEEYRSTMNFEQYGEAVRDEIEACYMYCGWEEDINNCQGYEPAYDEAYEKAYAEMWENEESGEGEEGEEEGEEKEDEEGGPGSVGGGSSGGSSGGGSSGSGSSLEIGGERYEPGEGSGSGSTSTNILPDDWDIGDILRFIVKTLMYGLGGAATIGVVVSGILYLTARDNEQQVVVAKRRLFEVVLGLAAWAMLYAALNWLIPGFNDSMLEYGSDGGESGMVEESEIAKETGFSL